MHSTNMFTDTDKQFFKALNGRVNAYFKANKISKYGNRVLYLKSAILFLIYIACYGSIYLMNSVIGLYACYVLMAPLVVFLALNIGHESAHNIYSKNKKMNSVLVYVFDFMGASSQIWKYKHVHSHHVHTNIYQVDL